MVHFSPTSKLLILQDKTSPGYAPYAAQPLMSNPTTSSMSESETANTQKALIGLINRKQIPLCKLHHDLVHDGEYDGELSLTDLHDDLRAQVLREREISNE